jgi:hypothetical protein
MEASTGRVLFIRSVHCNRQLRHSKGFPYGIHFDRLLEGKPLGQELTGFALETPWNDQVFVLFELPLPIS